jgi:hypothetical protein
VGKDTSKGNSINNDPEEKLAWWAFASHPVEFGGQCMWLRRSGKNRARAETRRASWDILRVLTATLRRQPGGKPANAIDMATAGC